jgi:hypothetical protein
MRVAGPGRLTRAAVVAVAAGAAVTVAMLPAGGVQAAAHGPAAGWTISTAAGGVGGPGRATKVSVVGPTDVLYYRGQLYVADSGDYVVRAVNPKTDWLTTPVGMGATLPRRLPCRAAVWLCPGATLASSCAGGYP